VRRDWIKTIATGMILLSIGGCAWFVAKPLALPSRNTIVLDQLVVQSDFGLPPHHRLLDEVAAQRGELFQRLNLPPSDEPVYVYLFESEERFNAFIKAQYPNFPARRAFFVESDTRLAVYAHWGDRVAEDLRHEVAHGYIHSVVPRIPLWLDEGLAEFFEVPRGNAGLNQPHVQLLLVQLLEQGWRPNMERLEQLNSPGAMTQADYAESWAWAHWLLETDTLRRELLQQYLQTLRKSGRVEPLSVHVRRVIPQPEQMLVEHLYSLGPRR
jgi:hypothetical protein